MRKSFVLDTNVLLHNSAALTSFADNEVVIPMTVLEELDEFKSQRSDLGRHAREVARHLDHLRSKGRLSEGVAEEETGGTVRVERSDVIAKESGLSRDTADNRILSVAWRIGQTDRKVIFVSKDINARIKADAIGVDAQDFEKQKVEFEALYSGWTETEAPATAIKELEEKGKIAPPVEGLAANQFVVMREEGNAEHFAVGRYDAKEAAVVKLAHGDSSPCGISARNLQQSMAIELLLIDDVRMVTLVGQAGTGKTLLALACGLQKVVREEVYEKMLVSRPIMPLGKDIGYLPGDKDEKLAAWMQPIFDNLEFIFQETVRMDGGDEKGKVDALFESNTIELEALAYVRGRSIAKQFLIVDEAQNLTPHEVKTIASRVGEGTKLVLTGDPYQIDNPYLDSNSNGLVYAAERMKGQELVGHVTLVTAERSDLAALAAELL